MKTKFKKEDFISNWTIFGAESIMIQIFHNKIDDNVEIYQGAISIMLDDGSEEESYEKNITVLTDIIEDNLNDAVQETFKSVVNMFEFLIDKIVLITEDMTHKEYDLSMFVEHVESPTIH